LFINNATHQQNTADFDVDNPWTVTSVVVGSGIALLALLTGSLLMLLPTTRQLKGVELRIVSTSKVKGAIKKHGEQCSI
jgi:hypothetical protein